MIVSLNVWFTMRDELQNRTIGRRDRERLIRYMMMDTLESEMDMLIAKKKDECISLSRNLTLCLRSSM